MTREQELEYNRWKLVVDEAAAVGIDVNAKKYTPLIKAMQAWGESLHALRNTQPADVAERAGRMAVQDYAACKVVLS